MDIDSFRVAQFLIWWITGVLIFGLFLHLVQRLFTMVMEQHKEVIDIAYQPPTIVGRTLALPLVLLLTVVRCFPEVNKNSEFPRLRKSLVLVMVVAAIFVWATVLIKLGPQAVTLGR